MSEETKPNNSESGFQPDPSLLKGSKFHDNINQVYIRTTEDKLRNLLRDFKDSHSMITKWTVPLGLVVSFGATLLTTSFVDKYGRPASFWEALFVFALICSVLGLIVCVIKAICCRSGASIERLIKRIKNDE